MIILSPSYRKHGSSPYRFVGVLKRDGQPVWSCQHGHHYTRTLAKDCARDNAWLVARALENQEAAGLVRAKRVIQGLERDGLLSITGPFVLEET